MRRLGESDVGPSPTASDAEWGASIIFARALAQNSRRDAVFGSAMAAEGRNKCSDLGLHSAASIFSIAEDAGTLA